MVVSRRSFIHKSLLMGLASLGLSWAKKAKAEESYELVAEFRDVIADWSPRRPIIIPAENICAAKPVLNLEAHEPSHFHLLHLSEEDMLRLRAGEVIVVKTEVTNGHDHRIRIDPSRWAPNGKLVQVREPVGGE